MPLIGQAKEDFNFVDYRAKKQMKTWALLVKGEHEGIDVSKIDPEILGCCLTGKNFRGEGLSMEELWHVFIGVKKLTVEEEERGKNEAKTKKEKREEAVPVPILARRVVGRQIVDDKGIATGAWDYGDTHFHDEGYLDFTSWLYARDQARKDLMWLCRSVLTGTTLIHMYVHRPVIDQCVSKNFDGVYTKDYALDGVIARFRQLNRVPTKWDPVTKNYIPRSETDVADPENYHKISMTMDPRDFFKSTIGRADAIQWMLAVPDVSMIILSADNNLAHTFVKEIKRNFFLPKGGVPTALQLLFPEYVLRGVKGTSDEPIESPARRRDRTYPTLWSDSIESTLSGLHCDILKFDDVVSNTNCQTPMTREKLRNHIDTTLSVNDTWGWIDFVGTRYFPDDYYGRRLDLAAEDSSSFGIKFFVRAAWYVKPEFKELEKKNLKQLEEHMVLLTFPQHASFKFLRGKLANEQTFRCQYLNQPVWGQDNVSFPEELLRSCYMNIMDAQRLRGEVIICWDTAKEANKNSDWSVGVAMKIFQKEDGTVAVVVLDVDFGKWTQADICAHMALLDSKWHPRVNQVEDTGGLDLMKVKVRDTCRMQFGTTGANFYWHKPDNEESAKRNRIKGLEILMRAQRFYFAVAPWNDETFSQFSGYTGNKSTRTRKDDIPDACSYISKYLPSLAPMTPKEQEDRAERESQQATAFLLLEQHRRIFGDNGNNGTLYVPTNVNFEPQPETPSRFGDLGKKLFGGNGLRA